MDRALGFVLQLLIEDGAVFGVAAFSHDDLLRS
jgi:hypothetical protein